MKRQMNTTRSIVLHAVGVAISGTVIAVLLGYAGAAYGASVDATGWAAIGYSAIAAILGFPLGAWGATVILGKRMHLQGSTVWSFVGMLVGVAIMFSILRSGTSSPVLLGVGALCLIASTLLGYYRPWRDA